MNNDLPIIETLDELELFLTAVESGGLGLEGVTGIAMATSNSDGRPFVAVLGEKHQLLLGRWVSQDVYENGKDRVRNEPEQKH